MCLLAFLTVLFFLTPLFTQYYSQVCLLLVDSASRQLAEQNMSVLYYCLFTN